ncbi:PRC-barrel domain-containing protein [Lewinella sp. JB7]|uniref:PRC-barrel domain-containing protein n=1 Tax=Lewinella sp. JB7 TaxID=2962887 RepID=UPI0020C94C62|nr:PRC-barrel domain-containing protein [Lewinella sp. JB7]MCP9237579.1 PRC-barrel domain-containing protein [Lewinella sp. JB7]
MNTTVNDDDRIRANSRLKFLDEISGYKVHHDDVDPRGYTVKLQSGESIGEVEGLLADTDAKLVRYVEVEIDDDIIERHDRDLYNEKDRHVLVPVGLIRIDQDDRSVVVSGIPYDRFNNYPRYERDRGYTTSHEIDTTDYLSDFHEFGKNHDRSRYATDNFRNADRLDDAFYDSNFYRNPSAHDRP